SVARAAIPSARPAGTYSAASEGRLTGGGMTRFGAPAFHGSSIIGARRCRECPTYDILWAVPTAGWWRMRAVRPIAKAALAAGLAAVALGLGLRGYMNRTTQDRLLPGEAADIAELRSPLPQPGFLACPTGYCRAEEAMASPIFEMSWADLREA